MTTAPSPRALPWAPGLDRDAVSAEMVLAGAASGATAVISAPTPEMLGSVNAFSTTNAAGVTTAHLSAYRPVDLTFALLVPTRDAVALWSPGSDTNADGLPPAWVAARPISALDGIPIGCLLGRDDQALITFGIRAPATDVAVRAGIVEETAQLLIAVQAQLDAGGIDILIDTTTSRFDDAVRQMGGALGLHLPAVEEPNNEPALCTWYAWHQDIDADRIGSEGMLAAELGFRTLIVDDGWQTAANERGYATCGDWVVEPTKFPDPARLVSALRDQGIQTMWWIGTPFLGNRSAASARGGLPTLSQEPQLEAAVLDPRSRKVRQHLLERLLDLVTDTGAAGLKIDFLDRWAHTPAGPPPHDAVSSSVPDAALTLLDDLRTTLDAVAPDILLEFREPYVGPEAAQRATMLRVVDCPMSPRRNRRGTLDLRLTTAGIAVHADPVMWAADDSCERVAQHLHNAMFAVPQVSVRLNELSPDHRETLAQWLALWRAYRDTLLNGQITVTGVADGYRTAQAHKDNVAVTVQYAPEISVPPTGTRQWLLANAHDARDVLISVPRPATARIEIIDCRARHVRSWRSTLDAVTALPIPPGGTAVLQFD
jgi:alpha-galactosidase